MLGLGLFVFTSHTKLSDLGDTCGGWLSLFTQQYLGEHSHTLKVRPDQELQLKLLDFNMGVYSNTKFFPQKILILPRIPLKYPYFANPPPRE